MQHVCVICPQGSINTNTYYNWLELYPWDNFVHAEEVRGPKLKSQWEMCQLLISRVILVRPGDYIAWSTQLDLLSSCVLNVGNVFSHMFGLT